MTKFRVRKTGWLGPWSDFQNEENPRQGLRPATTRRIGRWERVQFRCRERRVIRHCKTEMSYLMRQFRKVEFKSYTIYLHIPRHTRSLLATVILGFLSSTIGSIDSSVDRLIDDRYHVSNRNLWFTIIPKHAPVLPLNLTNMRISTSP